MASVQEKDTSSLQFIEVLAMLGTFKTQISMLQQTVKTLEKNVKKKIKTLEKEANKNKNKGNKKPTGFASPMNVTPEICKFMKVPEGTKLARTEVTKFLIQYIKENNLQNPKQKKEIKPDNALRSLLDIKKNEKEPLTYFNLQSKMNKHFVH
jgi:upstream activation factor subunit UAF30